MSKEERIMRNVVILTHDDKLLWDYDVQGFYIATLEDMQLKFQACCTPKEPSFFINGIRLYLGDKTVMELCNEIAIQSQRRRKDAEKLDEIDECLKKLAFPNKESA